MTSKEALKCLEPFRWDDKKEINAYEVLEELVNRDTSMKVVKEVDKKYVDANKFYERDIYRCGSCNNVLIIDRYQKLEDKDKINYCKECGQRLDWRKENE